MAKNLLFEAETTITFFPKDYKIKTREPVTLKDFGTAKWDNNGVRIDHNPGNGSHGSARTRITLLQSMAWINPGELCDVEVDDTVNDSKNRIFLSDGADVILKISPDFEMLITRQSQPGNEHQIAPIDEVVKKMIFSPPCKVKGL